MPKSPKKPTLDLLLSEIKKLKEAIEEHNEKFDELNRWYDISNEEFAEQGGWSSTFARDSRNIHRRLAKLEENAGIKVHPHFKEGAQEMYDRIHARGIRDLVEANKKKAGI